MTTPPSNGVPGTPTPKKQHIAQTLLSRAHSPDTATTLFTERIKQKPLYVRPTSPDPADNRQRRRLHRLRKKEYFLRRQKPQPLSARAKRACPALYALPKEDCKYEVFEELNRLWVEYMLGVLDLRAGSKTGFVVTPSSHGSRLVSADFHGAEVQVVRSRCASRVGVRGIVVRDSMFLFTIIQESGGVVRIPKEHTVFRFSLPLPSSSGSAGPQGKGQGDGDGDGEEGKKLVFELHGSQFMNRPVDRANKKFKWRNVDYV
ncbi:RNase P/RNase MRP complex subunit [Aspergillus homomorphus CBS 101889]|uniref:Ribonuclease P protein subunit n=1 Tax=Aspergillus homomorphus (strain CBS 101889) TaxID=1450537 RepID=A0A395I287_ASPHC|nr:RNase P/MRP, p29 subunit [Aspergillus homomorphus CBS 101889]RAL14067.1 RNase P/MRP, p29 subunit [Aspergillus homomorphus CBS 101889]